MSTINTDPKKHPPFYLCSTIFGILLQVICLATFFALHHTLTLSFLPIHEISISTGFGRSYLCACQHLIIYQCQPKLSATPYSGPSRHHRLLGQLLTDVFIQWLHAPLWFICWLAESMVAWEPKALSTSCARHSWAIWLNASFYFIFNMWNYWQSIRQCKRQALRHNLSYKLRHSFSRQLDDATRLRLRLVIQIGAARISAAIAICPYAMRSISKFKYQYLRSNYAN